MSSEGIIDAIGKIDDDMIREVEVLRGKRKDGQQRHKKSRGRSVWIRWGAAVACICVLMSVMKPQPQKSLPPEENAQEMFKDDGGLGGLGGVDGVTIPPLEVSLSSELAADMIGFFIYEGRCYVQYNHIDNGTDLIGEYLGTATGLIDEWTPKEGYVDFAGSVRGDFYSVKGYDPGFMLCMQAAEGKICTYICNNGLTLKYGRELYEERLHLSERLKGGIFESRNSWYKGLDEVYELDGIPDIVWAFIRELGSGEFLYSRAVAAAEGWSHMTDGEIYHLFLAMEDGITIHLRLHENGYVRFQGLTDVCIKIPEKIYKELIALMEASVL